MSQEKPEFIYSNPRKRVEIADWPSGNHKTKALFVVEERGSQQRALRTTWHPTKGFANATKKLTYAREVVFVDGNDGKLYILELTAYNFVSVMTGTLFSHESIFPDSPRYAAVRELFDLALPGTGLAAS